MENDLLQLDSDVPVVVLIMYSHIENDLRPSETCCAPIQNLKSIKYKKSK